MASDDSSGRPAAPIVIRIKLRYDDVEAMVQRFATNVGKSGLFLPTRSLQPIGDEIKFELRLADDTPALVGVGRVRSVKAPDPQNPRAAFGMAVELMRVTPQSRGLILRMLERRRAAGLPEVALPTAADIDAARRADGVEPAGRDLASGPVPVIAVAAPAAPAVPPGEALLTAPRRASGPMTVAKVAVIAPLAPEPPRRRRVAVSEVIERASGPVAGVAVALPGLDDDVDIVATIARARALAGDSLDAELAALCEVAAAPLEISIEAASAELARQLGGSAVRRDRSAAWAPPPATATPAVVADAPPAPAIAAVADADGAERDASGRDAVDQDAAGLAAEHDAGEPDAVELAEPALATDAHAPVEPSQPLPVEASDEEHVEIALAELDNDEHTEMGDMPSGAAGFELPEDADEFGDDEAGLGQLTVAESEPDYPGAEPPLELGIDEFDDFEILAEADASDADLLASHGEHEASGSHDRPVELDPGDLGSGDLGSGDLGDDGDPVVDRPSELDFASRLDLGDDGDLYVGPPSDEFSARHVIDLLGDELTGQHSGAGSGGRIGRSSPPDPHLLSAGAALAAFEADDADDPHDPHDPRDPVDDDSRVTDDPDANDGSARVRPIFEMDPSSSFTLAGIPSDSIDLDAPSQRSAQPIDPPRPRRASVTPPTAALPRHSPLVQRDAPVEDFELEHALEALDVDLDDLSIPHAATQLQRDLSRPTAAMRPAARTPGPQPRVASPTPAPAPHTRAAVATPSRAMPHTVSRAPASGRGVPRAPSEDGVEIDFDDDD